MQFSNRAIVVTRRAALAAILALGVLPATSVAHDQEDAKRAVPAWMADRTARTTRCAVTTDSGSTARFSPARLRSCYVPSR